jgi:hypothetical protein
MRRLAILLKFWKPERKESYSVPAKGDKWILRTDNGDPWGCKFPPVKVLDVKDGWVRYKIGDIIFTDERMKIEQFVSVYDYHS